MMEDQPPGRGSKDVASFLTHDSQRVRGTLAVAFYVGRDAGVVAGLVPGDSLQR